MSLLESLFGSLTGTGDSFTPPHALCPGNCPIGPDACEQCLSYKQKLNDALYNVDHLEEYYARYVVGQTTVGTTVCPYCGAPSADPQICEYCGMQIQEDDGKIRVDSANDIPDPIVTARDIIYERHCAVVSPRLKNRSEGLLSGLLSLFTDSEEESLGPRMSRDEILQAAKAYDIPVREYLSGLDNGTYLTLEKKQEADRLSSLQHSSGSGTGLAGGAVIGSAFSPHGHMRPSAPPPYIGRPPQSPPQHPYASSSRPGQSHSHSQQQAQQTPQQRPQQASQQRPQQANRIENRPRQDTPKPQNPARTQRPQSVISSPRRTEAKPPRQDSGLKGKERGNTVPGANSIDKIKR